MKKIALRHHLNKLFEKHPKDFEGLNINAVKIYLDKSDADPILTILKNRDNHNRFKLIIQTILAGKYNESIYKKEGEDVDVTAMRFSGKTANGRIYCLEVSDEEGKKIIMSKGIPHKSVQKNNKKIKDIILAVNNSKFIYCENKEEEDRFRKGA